MANADPNYNNIPLKLPFMARSLTADFVRAVMLVSQLISKTLAMILRDVAGRTPTSNGCTWAAEIK